MSHALGPRPVPASAALPLSVPADHEPQLDAERLDAYRVALEFQSLAVDLVPRRGHPELRDQLERASISIVLNIAEGAGRFSAPDKARFYAMARGSATECAAVVDLLRARGLARADTSRHARGLLVRIVQMLTKLIARMGQRPGGG
jgi:four helix bundle protein